MNLETIMDHTMDLHQVSIQVANNETPVEMYNLQLLRYRSHYKLNEEESTTFLHIAKLYSMRLDK